MNIESAVLVSGQTVDVIEFGEAQQMGVLVVHGSGSFEPSLNLSIPSTELTPPMAATLEAVASFLLESSS